MHRRLALMGALAGLPLGVLAQPSGYQVVRAEYGTRRRAMDVTQQVLQLVAQGQPVRVENRVFGRDPAPGEVKRLRVVARDKRGRERSFEYEEGRWFEVREFQAPGWGNGAPGGPSPGDDGGWRIVHARWGAGHANMDVTQRLRELARSDQRFRITNDLFGGDPAPGVVKSLRIVAVGEGGRRQRFEYPEGSVLDGEQFVGWGQGDWGQGSGDWNDGGYQGPQRPSQGPQIEWAEYRAEDGRRMDVTARLQDLMDRQGRVELVVSNRTLGGDPARGVPKVLWVRWRTDRGRTRENSWPEGSRVVLP